MKNIQVKPKAFALNDIISFNLDGRCPGKGKVTAIQGDVIEVALLEDCKEFQKGNRIMITEDEIIK